MSVCPEILAIGCEFQKREITENDTEQWNHGLRIAKIPESIYGATEEKESDQMEKTLNDLKHKNADLNCLSGMAFRGVINDISEGVVMIEDENGRIFHVDISKIVAVSEVFEPVSKPGFII